MDRRNFLKSSSRLMLVTSGLFVTGKFLTACHHDDNNYGGYYNGYYHGGYYDDRPKADQDQPEENQNQRPDEKSESK